MVGKKQNGNITSFFKPKIHQISNKRPLEEEEEPHRNGFPRSKSPKISTGQASAVPLAIRTDSPNAKRVGPPLAFVPPPSSQGESSELSSIKTPSESDIEDTIVLETREPIVIIPSQSFVSTQSSSSRKENKYGQVFITCSSDEDSDDLLEIDQLLGKKPLLPRPVTDKPPTLSTKKALSVPVKKEYVDTTAEDEAKFMNTVQLMKNDSVKAEREKEALVLAEEIISNGEKSPSEIASTPVEPIIGTGDILAQAGDRAPQLAEAMGRIEVQQVARQWSFFSAGAAKAKRDFERSTPSESIATTKARPEEAEAKVEHKHVAQPFPVSQTHPAWNFYQEDTQRELALIGGIFAQAAGDHQLPNDIFLWVLDQAFTETRKGLWSAVQSLLHYAGSYISSEQCLKILETKLRVRGAKMESISSMQTITAISEISTDAPSIQTSQSHLQTWLQIASILARSLTASDCGQLLEWVLTMTFDSAIVIDATILMEVRRTIAICLECIEENATRDEVIKKCLKHIFHKAPDVFFRIQCIRSMPTTSATLSRARRKLAIASFYEDASHIDRDTVSLTFLQDMQSTITKDFNLHPGKKTDYWKLAARLACLDIAIADGNRPQSTKPAVADEFNTAVDELAKVIKSRFAKIQATGAAHISRTEAKDILEAIEKRLRLTVRTKPRKRQNIYEQNTITDMLRQTEQVFRS